ncbi:hypothetical protein EG832_05390 [bacterium]|nr:hypothetical protein [bacterium]
MKRNQKITLLSFSLILGLGCLLGAGIYNDEPVSNPADIVRDYPLVLTGSATVKTIFLNGDTCSLAGSATFTASDDENCILQVTSSMPYGLDENGNCILMGDTQLWEFSGVFDIEAQLCHFSSCNNSEALYSKGALFFGPTYTNSFNVSCIDSAKEKVTAMISSSGLSK